MVGARDVMVKRQTKAANTRFHVMARRRSEEFGLTVVRIEQVMIDLTRKIWLMKREERLMGQMRRLDSRCD